VSLHAHISAQSGEGSPTFRWGGTDRDIPILTIAGVDCYLNMLGDDLGPWLLGLSDVAAMFAASVAEDGTRKPLEVAK